MKLYNESCFDVFKRIENDSVDCVCTDIPYGEVNRKDNGLRNLDKADADIATFDLEELVRTLVNKTRGSIYMFCGIEQVSTIKRVMRECGLSTRIVIWEKSNPSPMNGDKVWLSGVECCMFGKKSGATFNYHCKNTVIKMPCGRNKIHPTQKPVDLMKYLLEASTNEGDVVLDPFMGSGSTGIACLDLHREFIGIELNKEYFEAAQQRLVEHLMEIQ